MKKFIYVLMAMCLIVSCTDDQYEIESPATENTKVVTFTFDGFSYHSMTRTLTADKKDMTDLWLFDYIGDVLQQVVHQSSTDTGFGEMSVALDYGNHSLYFVTSRGTTPTVDTDNHNISWDSPSDTFWSTTSLNVTSSSSSSQSIELQRVATRFRITILDEVPNGAAKAVLTPTSWYLGIDYKTGNGTTHIVNQPRVIAIPSSYIGTTNLSVNLYGFIPSAELQTDITCEVRKSDESVLGSVTLEDVNLMKNITTIYSGNMFNSAKGFTFTLNSTWGEDDIHTW